MIKNNNNHEIYKYYFIIDFYPKSLLLCISYTHQIFNLSSYPYCTRVYICISTRTDEQKWSRHFGRHRWRRPVYYGRTVYIHILCLMFIVSFASYTFFFCIKSFIRESVITRKLTRFCKRRLAVPMKLSFVWYYFKGQDCYYYY